MAAIPSPTVVEASSPAAVQVQLNTFLAQFGGNVTCFSVRFPFCSSTKYTFFGLRASGFATPIVLSGEVDRPCCSNTITIALSGDLGFDHRLVITPSRCKATEFVAEDAKGQRIGSIVNPSCGKSCRNFTCPCCTGVVFAARDGQGETKFTIKSEGRCGTCAVLCPRCDGPCSSLGCKCAKKDFRLKLNVYDGTGKHIVGAIEWAGARSCCSNVRKGYVVKVFHPVNVPDNTNRLLLALAVFTDMTLVQPRISSVC